MKTKLREELRRRLENKAGDLDVHQEILNIMYEKWQNSENKKTYEDMINWIEGEYGEFASFAVLVGKYNQQVTNGGHIQYYYNGYAAGNVENDNNHIAEILLHDRMVEIFKKFDFNIENKKELLSILQSLKYQIDNERYIEEDEEEYDEDEEEYVTITNEYENDEYGEVVNQSDLSELDSRYYKICDNIMEDFETIMEKELNLE